MSQLVKPDLGPVAERVRALAEACGSVALPGTTAYDAGRFAWNTAVDQHPAAVSAPETVEELCRVVRAARDQRLRVTAQATGHAAAVLAAHRLDDVVLVRTGALRGVHVDPVRRVARVEAGACWQDVIDAAAPHGLTVLHGSAPDVGVVGYTLGGGLSWYSRRHGLAANNVLGIELVDANGEVVRADADTRAELFWALRGGGGNFGIVTTIEVALFDYPQVHAGMMLWDIEHAPAVLRAYAAWSPSVPEEVTASCRVMRFPPFPELPDFLRGRSLVILDAAALLDDEAAAEVFACFRALSPEMDTFATVPSATLTGLHMDPPQPSPGVGDGMILSSFDDAAVDALLAQVGPGVETAVMIAELRLLGGALSRAVEGAGALSTVPGTHVAFLMGMAPVPEAAAVVEQGVDRVMQALAPWSEGRRLLNFAERGEVSERAFSPQTWQRLRAVKADVDPSALFLGNHEIG